MNIIDSNKDGMISFSEYLVIAFFVNLQVNKIRHIFDDCTGTTDSVAIEHLWNKFLGSEVFRSVTLAKSGLDGRATSVTVEQLRKDFDHVVGCIIQKFGKLNSTYLEKL